jgi:hypothetical protein
VARFHEESFTLSKPHHEMHGADRRARRRFKRGIGGDRRHHPLALTEEGVPAAVEDAPKPSPVVFVAEASRAKYPWLPARVIAGSVWRGPEHVRVRIDDSGEAAPWRCAAATVR